MNRSRWPSFLAALGGVLIAVTAEAQTFDYALTGSGDIVLSGGSGSTTITVLLTAGATQSVSFSTSALPFGTTATFSPAACNPPCTTRLTIDTIDEIIGELPSGMLTVIGSPLGRTTAFNLSADFVPTGANINQLSNAGSVTVAPGASGSTTITATPFIGFPELVSFSASGLPSEATASFSPGSCTTPCSSTLTIALSPSTPRGTYPITVRGGLGTTTFALVVQPIGFTSLVTAVLPSGRSVQVGSAATAFLTVINVGDTEAAGVGISLNTPALALFAYQSTDPRTNQVIGTPNTPISIPPRQARTFMIGINRPAPPLGPTDVAFNVAGSNTIPVIPILGVNTLLLSASTNPVPDIVALAATVGNIGYVDIPGATGTAVFAVAAINVGAGATFTVSAEARGQVSLSLCQTNPATAQCISPIGRTVTTTIAAGATPTFSIFVDGLATVADDPARNRIFVRFRDGDVTRGLTSVAVRTR